MSAEIKVESERLRLRLYQMEDVEDALEYLGDMKVMRFIEMPKDYFAVMEHIQIYRNPENPFIFALEEKKTGKTVGQIKFSSKEQRGIYGFEIVLASKYHKKGYAKEIGEAILKYFFETLKAHKIYAVTFGENEASIKLLESIGMQREAALRQERYYYSRWMDELCYGILREDWEAKI